MLKPATVDTIFGNYRPPTMPVNDSDFWIMKCLLSDPRMSVKDLAKETSLSHKTVARRLEKMRENNVLQMFSIIANLSSRRLVGYIEFPALIYVKEPHYQNVVERIYHELQEYLNFHTSTGLWDQKRIHFCSILCFEHFYSQPNIAQVRILRRSCKSPVIYNNEFNILS